MSDIEKIDPTGEMLTGFNLGKGCIRVSKTKKLEKTKLSDYIHQTLDLWRLGKGVYC